MTTEQTLQIVKILLRHYGEHPNNNDALIAGALAILEGAPTKPTEHAPKKDKPKTGAPKKEPNKREPFDVGKLHSLYNGGWSAAMIAEEMGVSEATVYNYAKKEGLKFGSKK